MGPGLRRGDELKIRFHLDFVRHLHHISGDKSVL
jgi:hypothetical protein